MFRTDAVEVLDVDWFRVGEQEWDQVQGPRGSTGGWNVPHRPRRWAFSHWEICGYSRGTRVGRLPKTEGRPRVRSRDDAHYTPDFLHRDQGGLDKEGPPQPGETPVSDTTEAGTRSSSGSYRRGVSPRTCGGCHKWLGGGRGPEWHQRRFTAMESSRKELRYGELETADTEMNEVLYLLTDWRHGYTN